MNDLVTLGVCVLPLTELALHLKVPRIIGEMREINDPQRALIDLPFEISDEHPTHIVLGGFGATGCPSFTHHPEARELRSKVYTALVPEFRKVFEGRRLEVIPDRFGIRRKGTSVGGETWHRDVGPKSPGDIIFGGWLNLDPPGSPPQAFSCVPGNILPPNINPMGFAKFPREEYAGLEADFKVFGKFVIPPGHIIIFNQSIAHKITPAKAKFTSYRQYFGWRITNSIEPVYDKQIFIERQLMPPLPSGQIAPMYAKLHWANWQPRLREISTRFRDEFREPVESKRAGVVFRELPGLVASGLAYPPYTSEEIYMFYPHLL